MTAPALTLKQPIFKNNVDTVPLNQLLHCPRKPAAKTSELKVREQRLSELLSVVCLLCVWGRAERPGFSAPYITFCVCVCVYTFVPSIAYSEKWLVLYLKFKVTLRSCVLSGKPVQRTDGFTSSIYVYWLVCACEPLNVLTISPLQKHQGTLHSRRLFSYN